MSKEAPTKILFERASIKVTESRFDTGMEVFQIRKISDVRIDFDKRRTRLGIPLAVAGVAALLGGALINMPVLILSGAAFITGGTMMCLTRVNGSIVLTSRGREVKALSSKDAALLQAVTVALQEAMLQRK